MGPIDRLEDAYVEVSSSRATARELLELVAGSILFCLVASGLAFYLLGETAAYAVGGGLAAVFAVTILSQAYWAVAGREDYDDGTTPGDEP